MIHFGMDIWTHECVAFWQHFKLTFNCCVFYRIWFVVARFRHRIDRSKYGTLTHQIKSKTFRCWKHSQVVEMRSRVFWFDWFNWEQVISNEIQFQSRFVDAPTKWYASVWPTNFGNKIHQSRQLTIIIREWINENYSSGILNHN